MSGERLSGDGSAVVGTAAPAPREVSGIDRMTAAGVADTLIDLGHERLATLLLAAVRCCGEFPECSHVLGWITERDEAGAGA